MQDENDELGPYVDAADRLERSLDVQIDQLSDIDTKAEHVTRLVGVLLGAILTLLSLAARLSRVELGHPSHAVILAFAIGVASLLASMGAAILTYLSSKYKIGLHESAGRLLSRSDYETDMDQHVRRVLGAYAHNIQQNRQVIQTNAQRFRYTLLYLLIGIVYLATAGSLYLAPHDAAISRVVFALASVFAVGIAYYVLTGRYLTLYGER